MLKVKRNINEQDLEIVDLNFVKWLQVSENSN